MHKLVLFGDLCVCQLEFSRLKHGLLSDEGEGEGERDITSLSWRKSLVSCYFANRSIIELNRNDLTEDN